MRYRTLLWTLILAVPLAAGTAVGADKKTSQELISFGTLRSPNADEARGRALEWLKGTALRPLLDALRPDLSGDFLGDLGARLRSVYPETAGVVLFPFPRLFFVATRIARD